MKKIKYILLGFASIFLLSCGDDDFVVTPSGGASEEEALSTVNGFKSSLNGAYEKFLASGYYGSGDNSDLIVVWDALGDNVIPTPAGRNTNATAYLWRYNANSAPLPLFYRGYDITEQANFILSNIEKLKSYTDNQDLIDDIEGQSLAIRALTHFDMARAYCKIPTQSSDANNSLGIHYTDVFDPFAVYQRDLTVGELYDRILEDLTLAADKVNTTNVSYLNKTAVYGLLSRVYLHKGDWSKTVEYANKAIEDGASVVSLEKFPDVWKDKTTDGILWKVRNVATLNDASIGVAYNQPSGSEIVSEFVPSYDLYKMYSDEDVRKNSYFLTSETAGNEYNHVIKYLGREAGNIGVVDGKYLRAAEVYLNKAEALYELGDESGALEALNMVRENRYTNFSNPNEVGKSLEDAIQKERRLELAFEGDRFFTLKRRGESISRSASNGSFADGSGTPPVSLTLPASSYLWQLPIPQDAININSTLQQNEGY